MESQNTSKGGIYKYLLPIRCIAFLLIFVIGAKLAGQDVDDISCWWSVAASAVNVIVILMLVLLSKRTDGGYLKLINYQKGVTKPKKAAALILGFVAFGMSGMYLAGFICYGSMMPEESIKMAAPISLAFAVPNLIILPITTALAEDGLYLGGGVNHIGNKTAAIAVPAFFYALQHCFIPTIFDAKYIIYRFVSFLPLTIIFCIYYYKKRDPIPVMIAHVILDLATAVLILIMSASPDLYKKALEMI